MLRELVKPLVAGVTRIVLTIDDTPTQRYGPHVQGTGGVIRVVLVDEPRGWVAFFCTNAAASVADILGLVSDRFSLETCFGDVKEVGAGQQQVRFVWASVG